MKQRIKLFTLPAVVLSLAACGGGGGSADSGPGGTGGPVVIGQNGAVDVNTAGAFAQQMLGEVNAVRATARSCGPNAMAAVPPLSWNNLIMAAAQKHTMDMYNRVYLAHISPEGLTLDDRLQEAGYKYTYSNENIGSGTNDMNRIMAAWVNSPGHCMALMAPEAKELGAWFATGPKGGWWTLNFGAP